jgi:predicted MFS family arabinose efflux permease
LAERLLLAGWGEADRYRPLIYLYGAMGVVLALAFLRLSPKIESPHRDAATPTAPWGLPHSRGVVLRLAGLFALDSFGGGFVLQSIVAYWFHVRFHADPAEIGGIFFGANLFAGLSQLLAAWVANCFGLLNTMVFTHLPSNVLLFLVPLAPTQEWAVALLLLRFSISQMDVPTRQSYTMAVVRPEERSAASGVTTVARTIGSAVSPALATVLVGSATFASTPFMFAGVLKIAYDVILYRQFRRLRTDGDSKG